MRASTWIPDVARKRSANFRLSEDADRMLDEIAEWSGQTRTATLERIIRDSHRREKPKVSEEKTPKRR